MIVLGLTGSIGMGKSTTAAAFRRLGVPVFDSDATVHGLMDHGGSGVGPVSERFTEVRRNGAIDRRALGALVFGDDTALKDLEAILHPLVQAKQTRFLKVCSRNRKPLALLDIPLLYETGADRRCDAVAIATAPLFVQKQRVLSRPGMSREKFDAILSHQTSDAEKRRRADFVVSTGLGRAYALRRVSELVRVLRGYHGSTWSPGSFGTDWIG